MLSIIELIVKPAVVHALDAVEIAGLLVGSRFGAEDAERAVFERVTILSALCQIGAEPFQRQAQLGGVAVVDFLVAIFAGLLADGGLQFEFAVIANVKRPEPEHRTAR